MNGAVHYGMTKRWALEEGYPERDAELVARANIELDRVYPGHRFRNKRFHLALFGARRYARGFFAAAVRERDLVSLGAAIHCVQDATSHGLVGHALHWPGIDVWEMRRASVRERIEDRTRELLRAYLRATSP